MLKLNDIKTGDLITKRILEHLRQTENYDSFKIFIKFNLHQTTSKNCYPSPSNSNYNRASNTHKSNPWMSQSQIINPQFDIENNKLYIYGLFFINADASTDQCEPRVQDSNRLVFFLFNSVSESLKTSLIHTQSNSYLIRKSLFTTSNSSEHKFYISKNTIAKAASHQDLKGQQIQLRKLSDILKQNLCLNSQNDGSFLSMIDLIEENCAKTYVNSIVHFLASDVGDGVSIDKSTVQRLLRLGAKTKITDIDLTDYVRITCQHLQGHETEEPCSTQQTSYLQQKFEQIFLKRFQTIPGFNDLFVIQSDYFKDVDMLPPAEYSNDDDFSPSEETEENEAESDDLEANFFDSDANDLVKKKKRRKKKIDSSSPYSNLTKNISSTESFFVAREQVIGIEVICQVSCDPDSDLVESRTRTTTLTADNNELDDSMGAPSMPAQCSHSFATKFVKFDFNCALKLIDSREMPAIKSPASKINLNEATNSLKILLRFNWYSFNELNLNYPLNIFAASSSAQTNTAPNLSNHSSTNTQINFENFSYLEPCLNDLKWHLKDELLNSQTSIDSTKTFSQYVIHIKQGVEAAIVNCSKYSKKIVLSKVTTSKFNSSVDKSSKLNSALLQSRPPKLFTTTQTEEDKSLISVDPGKFFAELSSLLLSLKFYASKVQNLSSNFFFLDCSGQQVGFKIFLIVRLFDRREVTNGRNNKSSPSQSQEGGSSPNSQLKTSLQKQSTNELQKLSLPKNSLVYQETNISQLKMSAYFSFNHSDLSVKQDQHATKKEIVDEFESQMKTLVRLCYLKITLKDINESHKWNNSLVLTEDKNLSFSDSLSNSLSCSCVWSVYFKLHRLHQTLQKVHETNNYISQGLSKLRDCLHNFKIYESACADLYVYTKNTNDVFLLKLDEVYDDEERRQSSMLSRRPSYASINDSEQTIISSRNTSSQGLKSQNLSGGTHRIETQTSLTQTQAKLNPPEYVRLSVYGLEEPDDEMKKDLCKTLQAELDYCLLNRMSNSIEKNTYKTTSQQHPDKINDEDINFFKQASDSVFDYEVALPFMFNFSRTLREMFFFFIKQVFYANFKSIDPSQAKASNTDSQDQKYSNSQLSLFYIPESKHFAKKNSDTSLADAILISRIFFQNSKSKRIGKQNVSLILVEAFYSISGLDTSANRVTRSNSMGASSIKFEHDIIDKKLRQKGPSFVFKFYSKGETAEIINYKLLLRKAVRDALTYFLSDYITRIDPVDYTKKILLKKQPAKFRVLDSDFLTSKLHRKRHKSTGATELSSNKQFLQMNKAARESRLGRVLVSQNITDTAQFNSFVITNFSLNTFDHKDHEDTLQYFKQPRRMLNMSNEEYDSDESITSDSDEEINLYKVQRSISMEPELEKIHLDRLSNEKSYLKLIYDWLKGVHSNQTSSLGSFLLRKQLLYRTKYNLTNLVKDFEIFVKEMCKCDLGVNFFSFKKDGPKDSSRLNDSVFLDEEDFDVDEFANLKISKLSMVNSNLTKGENVIVTINAEYGGLSGFSSMSSSMNSSSSNQYTKVFSSGNSSSTLVQSSSSTTMSTVMVKSISSANGDSELPSNQSVSSQNLKRTFCFIIVNAKTKFVTFFCFTTESSNYDSLKQWLDQSVEIVTQRFHLVNNTVLYKFGGLIGDNIITDLKKVSFFFKMNSDWFNILNQSFNLNDNFFNEFYIKWKKDNMLIFKIKKKN
ncbi:hypothetical protein BpHYR1_004243 [Brachionus plicatilis]|uniref:Uncharacterized protein n=1 Tax=Brachionus plicatilis TaxID=10195 RepID=A0A3M7S2Q9_BRAPC|nr:hypothetical protein BpHYR1_004243 [Brachionus plicatilis]